jgi:glycosyltransferase involved in cell wall biosynthesis
MKIGFDAKRAMQNNTGLGNYSRYVIELLSEHSPDNNYYLFAPKQTQNPRLEGIAARKNVSFVFPSGWDKKLSAWWRMARVKNALKHNGITIFHGLSNELPMGINSTGIKSVVTLHDLIFLRYPQFYKAIDRAIYAFKIRTACRMADSIIAISECTKRDIVDFLHVPPEKIVVIYQNCHQNFYIKQDETTKAIVKQKYGLPPHFLLYVGTIEERKNLMTLVKSLQYMPSDVHLAAIGRYTHYQSAVERYAHAAKVTERLHIVGNAAFEDLPALYQSAAAFVYPSFFEGFGIPIVEALASGTPVIAATGSCLEEAGGDSIYINPNDAQQMAHAILRVLHDNQLAKRMAACGKEYIQKFSDANIAAELMKVYRSIG